MINADLYRELVPGAPPYRRTESDRAGIDLGRAAAGQLVHDVQPGLQHPRLVSSWRGSLDRLLFSFPSFGIDDGPTSAGYRSIIGALRPGTRFAVVHHQSRQAQLRGWFSEAGHPEANVTYVPLPDYVSLTDWAEDAYVALTDATEGRLYLVEPWRFLRAGDALIADYAEEYAGIYATQAPLIFQGGNCLIGDDFWLLGKDYFADSLDLLAEPRSPVLVPDGTTTSRFARRLFSEYMDADRELVLVGTRKPIPLRPLYGTRSGSDYFLDIAGGGTGTFQPIFHIDMFITLVGGVDDGPFRVLVGSPSMADDMLGTTSPFGLADVYDSVARDLAQRGLEVRRNPLVHRPTLGRAVTLGSLRERSRQPNGEPFVPVVDELVAAGAADGSPVTVRDWHHITWNNCLVENSERVGRHVYLPTYGHGTNDDLAVIDAHMQGLWEEMGFEVHPLADFNSFAERQGVVHCLKKYLDRGT